jgi:hypothetical protein
MNPNKLSRAHAPGENPARPLLKESAPRSLPNQYAELRRLIKQRGLLDRQPAYYAVKTVFTLGLLVVSLALLFILGDTWSQLLNAAYLAFVFIQLSLLAHDFGHRQFTFRSPWKNDWLTLVFGNLSLGVSRQWWIDKHNEHHGHPNQMDLDPDVDIPLLAFEEEHSVLKNSTMLIWRPDQELRDPFPAVFWPWFSGVGFVFDLPTGQIATFSTGWPFLRSLSPEIATWQRRSLRLMSMLQLLLKSGRCECAFTSSRPLTKGREGRAWTHTGHPQRGQLGRGQPGRWSRR